MNKKRAQSPLEYVMIIVAVVTSIMVMGPYVIRGVNAYMRSWEISAEQSQNDTSIKIQPWEVPGAAGPLPVNCGLYNNDKPGCQAAVGEDESQCWWWEEWVEVSSDVPEDCEVYADKCTVRVTSISGYDYHDGCTMSVDYCSVTNEDCEYSM